MSDTIRKLASIRKIENIRDIPGADMISMATIDGWEVVVKKGDFKPGDHVIYLEIDSWVPSTVAPFLTKSGKTPREYNGVPGECLKTVRFRGQISQGLILNYWNYPEVVNAFHKTRLVNHWENNDFDVTEILGIQKWEQELAANMRGSAKGNFPSFIPKTEVSRIQNMGRAFSHFCEEDYTWSVTEKLNGTSFTAYLNEGNFGVCSRNYDLLYDASNVYWQIASKYTVEEFLRRMGGNFAIQGEIIGNGVQGNLYKLSDISLYVFDVYDIDGKRYLNDEERIEFINSNEFDFVSVPLITNNLTIDYDQHKLLSSAEIKSHLNDKADAEGVVYRCMQKPDITFKCISNTWLLQTGK